MPKLARDHWERNETAQEESRETVSYGFVPFPGPGREQRARGVSFAAADMSFRIAADAARRDEGDEELFEASSAASGGESDGDGEDHFPEGAGEEGTGEQDHRLFVPQPLRRMNSDSIYDMSSMTSQLPAKKKGLSRYYEGRSQSFACMSEVRCLEDLQKKDNPYKQKIESCKSYFALGGMPKKPSSNSCANLNILTANGYRAPPMAANGYLQ